MAKAAFNGGPETMSQGMVRPGEASPMILIKDLVKSYETPAGKFLALKGVSFQVQQGEFVAIYGKSGAGKSTLINMVSGIDRPDSGEIWIRGEGIHTMSEDQRARWRGRSLGVVFQFFQLLPALNLIENITIAMDLTNSVPLKSRREKAIQLLEQVGIADHARKVPSKISGGQQQRVAIARALANNPALLLADEPTGNLDSKTRDGILDIFVAITEQGRTVMVVTHDREIAARASRVIEIKDGMIVKA